MRITENMMRYDFLNSFNKALNQQNQLQQDLSDGLSIHKPSDNPVGTVQTLGLKTSVAENSQYTSNLKNAQTWMSNTDSAISDLNSVMVKLKSLVVSADNTKSTSNLNTIGKEIDELINNIVDIGNTKVGDRYIFGGQNDSTQPFTRQTITDPSSNLTRDVIVYSGDNQLISMPTQQGAANPAQDSVNLTGEDLFGAATTVYGRTTLTSLDELLQMKDELEKTSAVSQTNSSGGVGMASGAFSGVGYANYDVRIDATAATTGMATAASYSTDGGNTWISLGSIPTSASISVTAGSISTTFKLSNNIQFTITNSVKNKSKDVYSFLEPQTPFAVTSSNLTAGTASISGAYTGSGATSYSVKVTGTNSSGQITGAAYSTDGGSTWNTLSNYTMSQSNSSLGLATMRGTGTTGNYDVKITGVDSTTGKITGITAARNGSPDSGAKLTYDVANDGTTSAVITFSDGESMTIPSDKLNNVGDDFKATALATPVMNYSTGNTALNLPNGVTLNVADNTKNADGDTFAFTLPQTGGPNVSWISSVAQTEVNAIEQQQTTAQTKLGTRMAMYELSANMMQDQSTNLQTDLSKTQGIDEAEAITEFNTAQTVYKAAMAVGAKIMQTSLVDYLK